MTGKKKITAADFREMDARFEKGKKVARALDAKAGSLPLAIKFKGVEFADFIAELTPMRFALLRLSKRGGRSIAKLAAAAGRDKSAVSKDIAKLKNLGLVTVVDTPNAGHGTKRVVTPIARNILIQASI